MSWAGLATNQTISGNDLQDAVNNSVFTALTTIPATDRMLYKSEIVTYVSLNESQASLVSKTGPQLVVKADCVPPGATAYSFCLSYAVNGPSACSIYTPCTPL